MEHLGARASVTRGWQLLPISDDVSSGGWGRLSGWGRQFGRAPRVSWQMMKDGRLPKDLESRDSKEIAELGLSHPRRALVSKRPLDQAGAWR